MENNANDQVYTGLTPLPANPVTAMAYIPFQTDRTVYEADNALLRGTLFPNLDKPFTGRRGKNG